MEKPAQCSSVPKKRKRSVQKSYLAGWIAHLEEHGCIKCPLTDCTYSASSLDEMQNHFVYCDGSEPRNPFKCPFCGRETDSTESLNEHIHDLHYNFEAVISTLRKSTDKPPEKKKKVLVPAEKGEDTAKTVLIVQPSQKDLPDVEEKSLSRNAYVRKRAFHKSHLKSWSIFLEKDGFIRCHLQGCKFIAQSIEEMKGHFGYCTGKNSGTTYECPFCRGQTTSAELLNSHIQRSHVDCNRFVATVVESKSESSSSHGVSNTSDKNTVNMKVLLVEWRSNGYVHCPYDCNTILKKLFPLVLHLSSCKKAPSEFCAVCVCGFLSESSLTFLHHTQTCDAIVFHVKNVNTYNFDFQVAEDVLDAWLHLIEDKGYVRCNRCACLTFHIRSTALHYSSCLKESSTVAKYECPFCSGWTKSLHLLIKHVFLSHSTNSEYSVVIRPETFKPLVEVENSCFKIDNQYACQYCEKQFGHLADIQDHMKEDHICIIQESNSCSLVEFWKSQIEANSLCSCPKYPCSFATDTILEMINHFEKCNGENASRLSQSSANKGSTKKRILSDPNSPLATEDSNVTSKKVRIEFDMEESSSDKPLPADVQRIAKTPVKPNSPFLKTILDKKESTNNRSQIVRSTSNLQEDVCSVSEKFLNQVNETLKKNSKKSTPINKVCENTDVSKCPISSTSTIVLSEEPLPASQLAVDAMNCDRKKNTRRKSSKIKKPVSIDVPNDQECASTFLNSSEEEKLLNGQTKSRNDESKYSSSDIISCGACRSEMTYDVYSKKHRMIHYGLCWIEGDRPLDFNDESYCLNLLTAFQLQFSKLKKHVKLFRCFICQRAHRHAIDHFAHLKTCLVKEEGIFLGSDSSISPSRPSLHGTGTNLNEAELEVGASCNNSKTEETLNLSNNVVMSECSLTPMIEMPGSETFILYDESVNFIVSEEVVLSENLDEANEIVCEEVVLSENLNEADENMPMYEPSIFSDDTRPPSSTGMLEIELVNEENEDSVLSDVSYSDSPDLHNSEGEIDELLEESDEDNENLEIESPAEDNQNDEMSVSSDIEIANSPKRANDLIRPETLERQVHGKGIDDTLIEHQVDSVAGSVICKSVIASDQTSDVSCGRKSLARTEPAEERNKKSIEDATKFDTQKYLPCDIVKCGACEQEMEYKIYSGKHREEHYKLCWIEGEAPVDFTDDDLCQSILKDFQSSFQNPQGVETTKFFRCFKCHENQKSVSEHLKHLRTCFSKKENSFKLSRLSSSEKENWEEGTKSSLKSEVKKLDFKDSGISRKPTVSSSDIIKCGLCKEEMTYDLYLKKHQEKHFKLCWIEGEMPLDFFDEKHCMNTLMKYQSLFSKSRRKSDPKLFSCFKCKESHKTAPSHLRHLIVCVVKREFKDKRHTLAEAESVTNTDTENSRVSIEAKNDGICHEYGHSSGSTSVVTGEVGVTDLGSDTCTDENLQKSMKPNDFEKLNILKSRLKKQEDESVISYEQKAPHMCQPRIENESGRPITNSDLSSKEMRLVESEVDAVDKRNIKILTEIASGTSVPANEKTVQDGCRKQKLIERNNDEEIKNLVKNIILIDGETHPVEAQLEKISKTNVDEHDEIAANTASHQNMRTPDKRGRKEVHEENNKEVKMSVEITNNSNQEADKLSYQHQAQERKISTDNIQCGEHAFETSDVQKKKGGRGRPKKNISLESIHKENNESVESVVIPNVTTCSTLSQEGRTNLVNVQEDEKSHGRGRPKKKISIKTEDIDTIETVTSVMSHASQSQGRTASIESVQEEQKSHELSSVAGKRTSRGRPKKNISIENIQLEKKDPLENVTSENISYQSQPQEKRWSIENVEEAEKPHITSHVQTKSTGRGRPKRKTSIENIQMVNKELVENVASELKSYSCHSQERGTSLENVQEGEMALEMSDFGNKKAGRGRPKKKVSIENTNTDNIDPFENITPDVVSCSSHPQERASLENVQEEEKSHEMSVVQNKKAGRGRPKKKISIENIQTENEELIGSVSPDVVLYSSHSQENRISLDNVQEGEMTDKMSDFGNKTAGRGRPKKKISIENIKIQNKELFENVTPDVISYPSQSQEREGNFENVQEGEMTLETSDIQEKKAGRGRPKKMSIKNVNIIDRDPFENVTSEVISSSCQSQEKTANLESVQEEQMSHEMSAVVDKKTGRGRPKKKISIENIKLIENVTPDVTSYPSHLQEREGNFENVHEGEMTRETSDIQEKKASRGRPKKMSIKNVNIIDRDPFENVTSEVISSSCQSQEKTANIESVQKEQMSHEMSAVVDKKTGRGRPKKKISIENIKLIENVTPDVTSYPSHLQEREGNFENVHEGEMTLETSHVQEKKAGRGRPKKMSIKNVNINDRDPFENVTSEVISYSCQSQERTANIESVHEEQMSHEMSAVVDKKTGRGRPKKNISFENIKIDDIDPFENVTPEIISHPCQPQKRRRSLENYQEEEQSHETSDIHFKKAGRGRPKKNTSIENIQMENKESIENVTPEVMSSHSQGKKASLENVKEEEKSQETSDVHEKKAGRGRPKKKTSIGNIQMENKESIENVTPEVMLSHSQGKKASLENVEEEGKSQEMSDVHEKKAGRGRPIKKISMKNIKIEDIDPFENVASEVISNPSQPQQRRRSLENVDAAEKSLEMLDIQNKKTGRGRPKKKMENGNSDLSDKKLMKNASMPDGRTSVMLSDKSNMSLENFEGASKDCPETSQSQDKKAGRGRPKKNDISEDIAGAEEENVVTSSVRRKMGVGKNEIADSPKTVEFQNKKPGRGRPKRKSLTEEIGELVESPVQSSILQNQRTSSIQSEECRKSEEYTHITGQSLPVISDSSVGTSNKGKRKRGRLSVENTEKAYDSSLIVPCPPSKRSCYRRRRTIEVGEEILKVEDETLIESASLLETETYQVGSAKRKRRSRNEKDDKTTSENLDSGRRKSGRVRIERTFVSEEMYEDLEEEKEEDDSQKTFKRGSFGRRKASEESDEDFDASAFDVADEEADIGMKKSCKAQDKKKVESKLVKEGSKKIKIKEEIVESSSKFAPSDSVKCGACGEEMIYKVYLKQHQEKHYKLCWIEGEAPVDLFDDEVAMKILTKYQSLFLKLKKRSNVKRVFRCYKCKDVQRSSVGHLSHLRSCVVNEEDRPKVLVSCQYCGNFMMRSSLKTHRNVCYATALAKKSAQSETPEPVIMQRARRSAAMKAEKVIKNLRDSLLNTDDDGITKAESEEDGEDNDYMVGEEDDEDDDNYDSGEEKEQPIQKTALPYYRKPKNRIANSIIRSWEAALSKGGEGTCIVPGCTFRSIDFENLRYHFQNCPLSLKNEFACNDCPYKTESTEEIETHVQKAHGYILNRTGSYAFEKKTNLISKLYPHSEDSRMLYTHIERLDFTYNWTLQFFREKLSENHSFEFLKTLPQIIPVDDEKLNEYLPTCQESVMVFSDENESSQFSLFQSENKESLIKIFVGGPIWSLAWAPTSVKQARQFLAVSTHHDMDSVYTRKNTSPHPGLIQIWEFPSLSNLDAPDDPKLVFAIAHDYGTVWSMEWCPSSATPHDKIGLLAVAFSSGVAAVYSIPCPESLPQPIPRYPVYKLEPCVILDPQIEESTQCTRITWQRVKPHNILLAGYSNGFVGAWDVNSTSPLIKQGNVLFPYHVFQPHLSPITGLQFGAIGENHYIVTCAANRLGVFCWDLNDTSLPIFHTVRSKARNNPLMTDLVWPNHWLSIITASDDAFSLGAAAQLNALREFNFSIETLMPQTAVNWSLSYCEWTGSIAISSGEGAVFMVAPGQLMRIIDQKHRNIKRCIMTTKIIEKSTATVVDQTMSKKKKVFELRPLTYPETAKKYGIKFMPVIQPFKIKGNVNTRLIPVNELNFYPLQSVNKVAWNPNCQSFLWLAMGYQNGFLCLSRKDIVRKDTLEGYYSKL